MPARGIKPVTALDPPTVADMREGNTVSQHRQDDRKMQHLVQAYVHESKKEGTGQVFDVNALHTTTAHTTKKGSRMGTQQKSHSKDSLSGVFSVLPPDGRGIRLFGSPQADDG
eukprot:g79489.t1